MNNKGYRIKEKDKKKEVPNFYNNLSELHWYEDRLKFAESILPMLKQLGEDEHYNDFITMKERDMFVINELKNAISGSLNFKDKK